MLIVGVQSLLLLFTHRLTNEISLSALGEIPPLLILYYTYKLLATAVRVKTVGHLEGIATFSVRATYVLCRALPPFVASWLSHSTQHRCKLILSNEWA